MVAAIGGAVEEQPVDPRLAFGGERRDRAFCTKALIAGSLTIAVPAMPFQPLASSTRKSFSAASMSAASVAVANVTGAMSSSRRRWRRSSLRLPADIARSR